MRLGGAALRYEARQYAAGADTDRGRQVQADAPHGSLRRGRTGQAGQGSKTWRRTGWGRGVRGGGWDDRACGGLGARVGWERNRHRTALLAALLTAQPVHAAEQFTQAQSADGNLHLHKPARLRTCKNAAACSGVASLDSLAAAQSALPTRKGFRVWPCRSVVSRLCRRARTRGSRAAEEGDGAPRLEDEAPVWGVGGG